MPPGAAKTSRPNIVFILTDDQDLHMHSLDYTPLTRKHFQEQGTFFSKHYCTVAVCCPSRVSLWTGKAAHSTNVTEVFPPYGGYPKFVSQGLNENYLPIWLQEAGYNTYYTGKLFNAHTVENYNKPYVKGFTASDFLLDPFTYQYLNASFQRNTDPPINYAGNYSTDVLAQKAYGLLDEAVEAGKPFFLTVAPNAPHSNVGWDGDLDEVPDKDHLPDNFIMSAPISAERHKDLFKDVKVPRSANFNPEHPSGAAWVRELPRQSEENVEYNDHFYRQRLRALQAVDELVDGLFERLEKHGLLDNTYIFYTTDNGYHIGHHRMQPGKETGYEEDVNIPLFVRGPGIAAGAVSELVTTHTDLAPTIISLIGAEPRPDFDGLAIPLSQDEIRAASDGWHEHVNIEYWGFAMGEGKFDRGFHTNNTYKALRVIGRDYNLYYSVWCHGEHELYDLRNDPGQLNNLLRTSGAIEPTLFSFPIAKVASRLDSLLFLLKSCKGIVCTRPWKALHPGGGVNTLQHALAPEFDAFYEGEQLRVQFSRCEAGYLLDAEGPQWEDKLAYRQGVKWSEWV
ncbi:Arylsulphatase [Trichodelitschia bisporula]|uniref:Arylsulfatase n=1 Tax=Trichodelitschia bisporula TaxID=703511 RepID=A0A6G1I432_9PEZI|nr:Arylsulphatase [Trichodelitschia bisporula]